MCEIISVDCYEIRFNLISFCTVGDSRFGCIKCSKIFSDFDIIED